MATMVWVITHPARDTRSKPQPGEPSGDQAGEHGDERRQQHRAQHRQQRRRGQLPGVRPQHLDRLLVSVVQLGIQRDQRKSGEPGRPP